MFDSLLMFESPVQIMVVLLIALIVFGPKRLPEIGKQIGSALRELKKAGSEVVNSFNTDHEPDHSAYPYTTPDYNSVPTSYSSYAAIEAPPDLTDYTIAGQPVHDTAHATAASDPYSAYNVSGADHSAASHETASASQADAHAATTAQGGHNTSEAIGQLGNQATGQPIA